MFPYSNFDKSEEIIYNYLENTKTIKVLSKGTYGITFLLELPDDLQINDDDNSFYKTMVPNKNYGKPVTKLIIKLQHIFKPDNLDVEYHDKILNIQPSSEEDFKNEINIQTDIFFKTLQYLQPLCPSIVYTSIINDKNKQIKIIQTLFNIKNKSINIPAFKFYNTGIIVMELVEESKTLSSYINDNPDNKKLAENISRYALLKLALDTEYNHNDFHKGNIMIQHSNDYFMTENGTEINIAPMLIDFGRTTKINSEIMQLIRESVNNKQYRKALSYLCDERTGNEYVSNPTYKKFYGWVCGDYNGIPDLKLPDSVDIEIDKLFVQREIAINAVVTKMDKLHSQEPNKYPLLPISNAIKNKLYNGMIGGKKKQKYRKKGNITKRTKGKRTKGKRTKGKRTQKRK